MEDNLIKTLITMGYACVYVWPAFPTLPVPSVIPGSTGICRGTEDVSRQTKDAAGTWLAGNKGELETETTC